MVDFTNILDPSAMYELASSQAYDYWITLGINLVLSTIVGGILLAIVLEVFSRKFNEPVSAGNAFLAVLVVNIINLVGVMGLLIPFTSAIPLSTIIVPLLVWIGVIKLFFGELSFMHAAVIGIVFFAVTLFAVPALVGMLGGFIPSFG